MLRHPNPALRHYRPHRLVRNNDDQERFSSFQSPPHSDGDHEEFSDFETSREMDKIHPKGSSSSKKQKPHILVEQLPLQCDNFTSSRKTKQQCHPERSSGRSPKAEPVSTVSRNKKGESGRWKENCPLPRYNYMEKIERHLSTIAQDTKQHLRESALTSLRVYRPDHVSKVTPFDLIYPNNGYLLHHDPNIVLLEKQRMEMLLLQQENISLRERVFALEKELKTRDEQRIRKEVESKIISMAQEEPMSRKEAKLKLVEEIATLQTRCREMKQEMRQYKEKQEETFTKLTQQRESAQLEVVRLKTAHDYQTKFTQVFLNMVEKLPVDLEQSWSKKRKIAVGWKVVKHLVKKAFKLGIHPPAIAP